jgi:hypothetical protein
VKELAVAACLAAMIALPLTALAYLIHAFLNNRDHRQLHAPARASHTPRHPSRSAYRFSCDSVKIIYGLNNPIPMDLGSLTIKVERDEDGFYVGSVVELHGCHTQAKNVYELLDRLKEALALYVEEKN